VFEGFFNNWLFLFIEIVTIIVQVGLVEVGGEAVKTSHLTLAQHGYCIAIGFGSIIFGFFLKLIPRRMFVFNLDDKSVERSGSIKGLTNLRKSSRLLQRKMTRVGSEKNLGEKEVAKFKALKSMKTYKY